MTGAVLAALVSHWRRQPLQLVTLVLGLALATGLWSAVQAINAEARANYAAAADRMSEQALPRLVATEGADIPLASYVALRRAGWNVTPVLEGGLRPNGMRVTVLGVDFLSYPFAPSAAPAIGAPDVGVSDDAGTEGGTDIAALLAGEGLVFAVPELAARLERLAGLPPVRSGANLPPGVLLTDIGTAERLLERPGQISHLLVLAAQPRARPPLAQIAPSLTEVPPDRPTDTAQLTRSFHLNLTAFGLLSFAVGLFIVHGTIGLAFEQRRGMVRTLRALGVPLGRLAGLLLIELLVLAALSGALGLVLGYLVAGALLPDVAATLRGLYGAEVDGSLTLRPAWIAAGLAMAVAGALAAGGQALWRLWRMPLLAAPGPRAWADAAARSARLQAGFGLALIGIGAASVLLFDGLIAGFALLAGLLLGTALLLPPLLGIVLSFGARRARSALAEWIWADARAQLPGLSLALMALLLALAANIGVGTMVSSFRLTFTGWLDQRLASELYVTARTDAQGAAIAAWLAPRADAVLPVRSAEVPIAGRPGQVYGILDHATYRENWPLLEAAPDVWDRVARGEAALINEQLARAAGIWTGQTVPLGPDWALPVAGVYSDYGNPSGQAIVSLPALLARHPSAPARAYAVRIAPDRVPGLTRNLRAAFDLPADAIMDQAAAKALSISIFDKTFVITGALNVLTLGVAGFAILTSLLTLWTTRLPQLAPVWALGLTRARLARLELLRSLALAGLTALLAVPVGLALAWALLAVINVEAFGWRLPMYLFPLDWLRLGALALVAAALAAAWPARRMARVPPAELMKVFANER